MLSFASNLLRKLTNVSIFHNKKINNDCQHTLNCRLTYNFFIFEMHKNRFREDRRAYVEYTAKANSICIYVYYTYACAYIARA